MVTLEMKVSANEEGEGVSLCDVGGRIEMSPHRPIDPNHEVFYDFSYRSSLGRFVACQKSLLCEKNPTRRLAFCKDDHVTASFATV